VAGATTVDRDRTLVGCNVLYWPHSRSARCAQRFALLKLFHAAERLIQQIVSHEYAAGHAQRNVDIGYKF